jgi:hypothetical protein
MTISGITDTSTYSTTVTATSSASGSTGAVGGHHHHHGGGGGGGGEMMQGIEQALNQMGISFSAQPPSSTGATGQNATTQGDGTVTGAASTTTQNPMQALHQLMGDVFQAAQAQQSDTTNTTGATSGNQYGNFASNLQSLITSLNSSTSTSGSTSTRGSTSTTTTGNSTLDQLQSDFSNFLASIQQSSGSTSSTSQNQNVVTFLQNLESSLGNEGVPPTGGLVGTST